MPAQIVKRNEKKVHPFRMAYHLKMRSLEIVRLRIQERNNWSQTTFYRKMKGDEDLTKEEAEVVAAVLNISVQDIEQFQGSFPEPGKKKRNA